MPKRRGNEWEIPIPAKIEEEETHGVILYLREYLGEFKGSRIGIFSVDEVTVENESIISVVRLAPWELGVKQKLTLTLYKVEAGWWSVTIHCQLMEGPTDVWERSNRLFIDNLRKQILEWRAMHPSERMRFIRRTKNE